MDNMAKNFCMTTFTSNSIIPLIYSSNEDMLSMGNAIRNLDVLVIPNTYIQSIYTYDKTLDLFISSLTHNFNNSKDFYDDGIVKIIKNIGKSDKALVPIPRRIHKDDNSKDIINVYTYLMYNPLYNTGKIDGAVVLNIKSDWLKKLIAALNTNSSKSKNSNIIVIDKNGIVISHAEDDMFLKDISSESYIEKVLSSSKDTGTFIDTIDKKKVVVTYVSSQELGWKFISLTPYKEIINTLKNVKLVTIVFCLLVLLVGTILSMLLSKRLYIPINELVGNIRKKLPRDMDLRKKDDEVKYLSSAFECVIGKVEEMEKHSRNSWVTSKNDFLKFFLSGKVSMESDELKHQLRELDIGLNPYEKMSMFILKIDEYKHFINSNNERDRSIWRFAISNIANEITAQFFISEAIDMGNDHIVILFNIGSRDLNSNFTELISKIISDIQANVLSYINISLSAGVGYTIDDCSSLSSLYEDTLTLSLYRIKCGHMCVIFPELLDNIKKGPFLFPTSKEKILIDSLRLGDLERANDAYLDIISAVLNYSYDNIMASIIYLLLSIHNSSVLMQKTETKVSFVLSTLFTEVSNLETVDEINGLFFEVFKEIIDIGNKVKSKKTDVLINNIIGMIEDNYQDKGLCLNSIADSVNMSPVYIGKLFKDDMAKSVAEYINNFRMEKVIQLLKESQLSTDEILEKCGIEKSSYFYTSFKKYAGVSLGEYRLKPKNL
jgi:Response regulator containing CheY-like receiver domain and AraC-type DNA-binding domain